MSPCWDAPEIWCDARLGHGKVPDQRTGQGRPHPRPYNTSNPSSQRPRNGDVRDFSHFLTKMMSRWCSRCSYKEDFFPASRGLKPKST